MHGALDFSPILRNRWIEAKPKTGGDREELDAVPNEGETDLLAHRVSVAMFVPPRYNLYLKKETFR